MKTILIIEDDKEIAELERDYLHANNFHCDLCDDGDKGCHMALTNDYALIILDVMLPNMDGLKICSKIRETSNVPIIIVSAKREDEDKIQGLNLGANDFIVKPFHPQEMVARVKSQINNYERLTGKQNDHIIQIRDLIIHSDSHEVFINGKEIILPNKEYELLVYLAMHPNIVFSKSELFETIWGLNAIGEINTVTVHINRIREKIEADSSHPTYIETVWGSGYRLRK